MFTKKQNTRHYIMVLIGILIVAFFWVCPTFGEMTRGGMQVLGIFIAVIFLWSADEVAWSSVFGIVMIAFAVKEIYPEATDAGIYQSISLSVGSWLITFIIACLLLAYAVTETGVIKRIASAFIRSRFAKRGPWQFTLMLAISALVIGCFLDPTVTLVFYLGLCYSIFEMLGYKKGDAYPSMVITLVCFTLMISYVMTPISHASILTGMGLINSLTGMNIDFLSYMIVGIPIGVVCFFGMYFIFRRFYKCDVSNFEGVDFDKLAGEKTPWTKREIWATVIFLCVVAEWLLSGLLNIIAPNSYLCGLLSGWTSVIPVMVGVVILMVIRVEGRPLLNFTEGLKNGVPWNVIILLCCVFAIGTVLTESSAGFTATVGSWLAPIMNSNMAVFLIMGIIAVLLVVATNLLNNIPIMMLALNVLIPLALGLGVGGAAAGMAILIPVNLAFATPASFANNAIVFADEWTITGKCYKFGIITAVWCMIACGLLVFPWANLLLG